MIVKSERKMERTWPQEKTFNVSNNDTITNTIVELAHENNRVVQWRNSIDVIQAVFNNSAGEYRENFLNSLLGAMDDCNIDGIEFDFEWHYRFLDTIGIVLPPPLVAWDVPWEFLAPRASRGEGARRVAERARPSAPHPTSAPRHG